MLLKFAPVALVGCFALAACDVDQTKEGELPEVEVNATGGQLPEYDVDAPEVNVGMENKTVQVPTVDVDAPKDDNKELFLNEAADLMYHYLVLLQAKGFSLSDVESVLKERHRG